MTESNIHPSILIIKVLKEYQPMTFSELQKMTELRSQNLNYYLKKLQENNLVFYQNGETKTYLTQPAFVNEELMEYLVPFIDKLKEDVVFIDDEDKEQTIETLSNVLEMYFALNVVDITKNNF